MMTMMRMMMIMMMMMFLIMMMLTLTMMPMQWVSTLLKMLEANLILQTLRRKAQHFKYKAD